jgi:hypothetical protein
MCLANKCVYNIKDEPECCETDVDCGVSSNPCVPWACSAGECRTVFEGLPGGEKAKEGDCCLEASDCEEGLTCPLGSCVDLGFTPGDPKKPGGK